MQTPSSGIDKFLQKSAISIEGYNGPVEFKEVILEQAVNNHHYFSFFWRPGGVISDINYQRQIVESYIGKSLSISFNSYRFQGLITSIGVIDEDGATRGFQVAGVSPTILLDDVPQSTSYYQKNLQAI
jgi:type VI secretion system secreted protein VgrG